MRRPDIRTIRRAVVGRAIAPISAVSRTVVVIHRTRSIPRVRRTIGISPSAPDGVIVISAARAPIPSPPAPSPWAVINEQSADSDANSKSDQRSGNHTARGTDVNHGGIVLRNVDHLRICRLDYVHRLSRGGLLHFHLIISVGAQCAGVISLRAQTLNRIGDGSLVGCERVADGAVVVDVLGHHGDDLRKIHQRDKCGIESGSLRRVSERSAGEIAVCLQPIIDVENFLWIGAGGGDLSQQSVGIERDRSQQLVQFVRSGRSLVLRAEQRDKVLRKYERDE